VSAHHRVFPPPPDPPRGTVTRLVGQSIHDAVIVPSLSFGEMFSKATLGPGVAAITVGAATAEAASARLNARRRTRRGTWRS
jgi:hypothetical protein